MNSLWQALTKITTKSISSINAIKNGFFIPERPMATLLTMHLRNMKNLENPELIKKKKKKASPLEGKPFAKGIILKTVVKKPRKPNSANRKCVLVKLSTGKEMVAYIPGVGNNLQEHQAVLCRVGRLKDTPGVKIRCIRGKYDLSHVKTKDS